MKKRSSNDKASAFLFYWKVYAPIGAPLPVGEYNFDGCIKRRHLFDLAWPYKKVAVEVDGNAWNVKGGGYHAQDTHMEKNNIAVSLGWRVFHFSPGMLIKNPAGCVDIVVKALEVKP